MREARAAICAAARSTRWSDDWLARYHSRTSTGSRMTHSGILRRARSLLQLGGGARLAVARSSSRSR